MLAFIKKLFTKKAEVKEVPYKVETPADSTPWPFPTGKAPEGAKKPRKTAAQKKPTVAKATTRKPRAKKD